MCRQNHTQNLFGRRSGEPISPICWPCILIWSDEFRVSLTLRLSLCVCVCVLFVIASIPSISHTNHGQFISFDQSFFLCFSLSHSLCFFFFISDLVFFDRQLIEWILRRCVQFWIGVDDVTGWHTGLFSVLNYVRGNINRFLYVFKQNPFTLLLCSLSGWLLFRIEYNQFCRELTELRWAVSMRMVRFRAHLFANASHSSNETNFMGKKWK